MRKSFPRRSLKLYLASLLLIGCYLVQAQVVPSSFNTTKWRFSDPKQFGFTVLDVHFYDNNFGIAVGANGGIARTTDGGAKWQYGPFSFTSPAGTTTTGSFMDVHVSTPTIAYAVGSNGMMAKTTDAGQNWSFVRTPLYIQSRSINACWFLNKDTGYIGGTFNSPDSIPKIYVTRNGGNTWDSLAAPFANGKTRVGYISNPNLPSQLWDVDAKAKDIYRIQFLNDSTGYVNGSGSPLFPAVGPSATLATCLPNTGNLTTGAQSAALLWKISKNVITDYSLSKERLGYTGINTSTVNCTTSFNAAGVTPAVQTYRALSIINDSTVVMMSFNNNTVVRVNTGKNDSTANVNAPGTFEKGKYQILNFPFPPTGGPNAGPAIPATQVLLASNPYQLKKSASGKLMAAAGNGLLWTSIDTGKTWVREFSLPQGRNYSSFATWAMDILPNGKVVTLGQGGVVADSMPGGAFNSTYEFVGALGNKVDFVDCNNGIITGGGNIAVTTNGGKSWVAKNRQDFINSFYNIGGLSYVSLNKAYFAVSNGQLYTTSDQATTLDPIFSDFSFQMNDVVGIGNDTIYAVGYSQFSVPAASRKSSFFRSVNGGSSFQTIDISVSTATPAFTAPTLSKIAFPSRQVGYAMGSRNAVYKTADGGSTWINISPFPALNDGPTGFPNARITYTGISALNDNTVFVVGNMFTDQGVRRVYKTIDGGANWIDITGNLPALSSGNLTNVLFSDVNNGYVVSGNTLYITNNSGASWTMEIAPHGNIHNALGFAPRSVPAGIPFANRKLFIAGLAITNAIPTILEFGDTLNVNVNAATVVVNATCSNLTAGSVTVNASGGLAPYTYSINGGAYQASNVFTGLTQGVKTISVKDAFCGLTTKTVNVGFTDNLTLTAAPSDTTVCAGAPVQLRTTGTATSYAWSPATGLSSTTIANPVATTSTNRTYTVTASLNGCTKTSTVNVNIKPNPIVSAGPDKTIVEGADVRLEGSGSSNSTSIAWTPAASLTNPNTFTPLAKPLVTTNYTLTVNNSEGCVSTDDVTVTVIPYCVKVMNAFTPNGDAINDRWIVTTGAACTNQVMVKVFNRYGSEVYSNDNYKNDWDGTYKGKAVPDGTYYYTINFRLISGRVVPVKGDVTILR